MGGSWSKTRRPRLTIAFLLSFLRYLGSLNNRRWDHLPPPELMRFQPVHLHVAIETIALLSDSKLVTNWLPSLISPLA